MLWYALDLKFLKEQVSIAMDDDDLIPDSFDPYDMLQEHNLLIQRLIKAHNAYDRVVNELAKQNVELTQQLVQACDRLDALEHNHRRLRQ